MLKKILSRIYLEDKLYNVIVLHLWKEMRLNDIGTPDEVTLIPLNKIESTQPPIGTKQTEIVTQNTKKGYCFYYNNFCHFKAECRKMNNKHKKQRKN